MGLNRNLGNITEVITELSGKIGVGTANPAQKLQINGPLALSNLAEDFTTNQEYAYPIIYSGNLSGLGNGELVIQPRTTATRSIRFVTRGAGAVSSTNPDTKMMIRWDGNIGIGSTNPEFKLDVAGGDIALSRFQKLQFTGGTVGDRNRAYIGGNGNNDLIFAVAAGAEAMRIHNSSNVLIGTTTDAGYKLDVNGTGRFSSTVTGTCPSNANGDGIRAIATNTGASGSQPGIGYWTAAGSKRFINQLDVSSDTWGLVNATGSNIIIATQAGNVGIRTQDPRANLEVEGGTGININNLGEIMPNLWRDGGDGGLLIRRYNKSTNVFVSIAKINPSSGAYSALSDVRLKENISDSDSAIEKVLGIKVRKFDWKSTCVKEDYGFIAQELHEVLPQYVYEGSEDINWGVAKAELVPLLVKAIQEQQETIKQLTNRIINLENK